MFGWKLIRQEDYERLLVQLEVHKAAGKEQHNQKVQIDALKNRVDVLVENNAQLTQQLKDQSACEKCSYERMFDTQHYTKKKK